MTELVMDEQGYESLKRDPTEKSLSSNNKLVDNYLSQDKLIEVQFGS